MRLVAVFMLVAAAGAMESTKRAEMLSRVQATEFGATVLADLQDRLHVADPIQALSKFIGNIRARIKNQTDATTAAQEEKGQICLQDVLSGDESISKAVDAIAAHTANIGAYKSTIDGLRRDIITKKIQIHVTTEAIQMNKDAIESGNAVRAQSQAAYEQAVNDTKNVKAAIEEIIQIEKESTLHSTSGETHESIYENVGEVQGKISAANAVEHNPDVYSPTMLLAKFQSAAAKIQDPTAQSFVQLAALSSEAFGSGEPTSTDTQVLKNLLQDLLQETIDYANALDKENEEDISSWNQLKGTMQDEIDDWTDALGTSDTQGYYYDLSQLQKSLNQNRQDLNKEINEYNQQVSTLTSHYNVKQDDLDRCSGQYDQYLTDMEQFHEELETLQLIYDIIKDKLVDKSDDIAAYVGNITEGSNPNPFANTCHCDLSCDVFNDCCAGCARNETGMVSHESCGTDGNTCCGTNGFAANSREDGTLNNLDCPVPSYYDQNPIEWEGGAREAPLMDGGSAALYHQYYNPDQGNKRGMLAGQAGLAGR